MQLVKKPGFSLLVSVVLASGLVLSTLIGTLGLVKIKTTYGSISVTGSAKEKIKSDFAVWNGNFAVQRVNLTEAYAVLRNNQATVKKYLIDKGIKEDEISFQSINTNINYVRNYQGMQTNEIESYRLSQNVEIRSNDVDEISVMARESTELIDKGIEFQSYPAQYFYTKIADKKVNMLAQATEDAKNRAEKVAQKSGAKIVGLKTAKMGVFQITPLYSNEISDYGINDTSSIEKEIMSVMNCEFKTK